jgi:hypothetical protein
MFFVVLLPDGPVVVPRVEKRLLASLWPTVRNALSCAIPPFDEPQELSDLYQS